MSASPIVSNPTSKVLGRWIGRRFGRLIVASFHAYAPNKALLWVCHCDCGNTTVASNSNLLSGRIVSCGCYYKETRGKTHRIHGMYQSRAYQIWGAMRARCTNPGSPSWKHYGGRGIQVCTRWNTFENFYADMGDPPAGLSIDRIDNNGDYEPSNCRWATTHEQSRNRRDNIYLECNGIRQTFIDWANSLGLSDASLRRRLARGWSLEDALTIPKYGKGKGGRS